MKTNSIKIYALGGVILLIGIFIGSFAFNGDNQNSLVSEHIHVEEESGVWTCSMHPHVRLDKPGKCPICAMDLIPVKKSGISTGTVDPDAIQLSDEAVALANVQTTIVNRGNPVKELRLYGTIKPNERLLRSQVSHVSGRIENLIVNTIGESIRSGQIIAMVYSPDLLNAQQELIEAKKLSNTSPELLKAAREKLRSWKLTDSQIMEIEKGEISSMINIKANVDGVVIQKKVEQGDYISQGSVLYDLADLSVVWAVFDAYESDLPYLKIGDRVDYTLRSLPDKTFSGKISFIDPIVDKTTRTVKIRVETANTRLELKPEMYAVAVVKASLKQSKNNIVIPTSAVLWTGKRSIVYVKRPSSDIPTFKLREIELGASLGQEYVVLSGLEEGEEIVTNGVFSIDASAQLEGKRSMMNRDGAEPARGHQGHNSHSDVGTQEPNPALRNEHVTLRVEGLCDMCKERIDLTAKGFDGVLSAAWDKESKQLHLNLNSDKVSLNTIAKAIASKGHDNALFKANNEVYNSLPGCCKYRD